MAEETCVLAGLKSFVKVRSVVRFVIFMPICFVSFKVDASSGINFCMPFNIFGQIIRYTKLSEDCCKDHTGQTNFRKKG